MGVNTYNSFTPRASNRPCHFFFGLPLAPCHEGYERNPCREGHYASAGLRWAGVVQYVLPRSYPHSQIKNWLLGFRTVSVYIDMCVYRSRLLSGTLRVLEANYKPTISQPRSQLISQL